MKRSSVMVAALAAAWILPQGAALASKMAGSLSAGTVTAAPIAGEIEIDHRIYHVKPHSAADDVLRSLNRGDVVDVAFDGLPGANGSQVVGLVRRAHP